MDTTQNTYEQNKPSAGYYVLSLGPRFGVEMLHSNNERAFIISQLQDILSRRSLLEIPGPHQTLAAHIDLLAFSITRQDIRLIVFSLSYASVLAFGRLLVSRLQEYQSQWQTAPHFHTHTTDYTVSLRRLIGPHHALKQTVKLHLRHPDWEYDRYSSIGFYLHDRRGEWMHLWRLSRLYENNVDFYRQLIMPQLAPLSHG